MYKHIFFDLDHTLWDHSENSKIALEEVYVHFDLHSIGIPSTAQYHQTFNEVNHKLWLQYERGLINQATLRHDRFRMVFSKLGVDDHRLCDAVSDKYLEISPRKSGLLPYTQEILAYLRPKYPLHIITNGFNEIQAIKMQAGKIDHYFEHIVTPQNSGFKKPDAEIYYYALDLVGVKPRECLMIGDTFYTDVLGAMAVGIDAVFFNPNDQRHPERPTYEISHLKELKGIL
jgi:YjjG family noncanonical pyrimidine nucleotidase